MSDYTPRLWVKGGFEQFAGSVAAEVRLRYAGWRPKDEPASAPKVETADPAAGMKAEEPAADSSEETALPRSRRKSANSPST